MRRIGKPKRIVGKWQGLVFKKIVLPVHGPRKESVLPFREIENSPAGFVERPATDVHAIYRAPEVSGVLFDTA